MCKVFLYPGPTDKKSRPSIGIAPWIEVGYQSFTLLSLVNYECNEGYVDNKVCVVLLLYVRWNEKSTVCADSCAIGNKMPGQVLWDRKKGAPPDGVSGGAGVLGGGAGD